MIKGDLKAQRQAKRESVAIAQTIMPRAAMVLVFGMFLLTLAIPALAHAPSPLPIIHKQPDGTEVVLYMRGKLGHHWEEDANGYTVLYDQPGKRYVYAKRQANGQLGATAYEVGKVNPRAVGLQKRELPSQAVINQIRANGPYGNLGDEDSGASGQGSTAPLSSTASATVLKNLVVMVRFSDHTSRTLPSVADVDVLFNSTATSPYPSQAPTGSIKQVYLENSYGMLELNSTVFAWVTVSNTEAYYANGNSGLSTRIHEALKEALDIVDTSLDFAQFDQDNNGLIDAITFLHSGYAAEFGGTDVFGTPHTSRIWSHKWSFFPDWISSDANASNVNVRVDEYHISPAVWGTSGTAIGRIGVIAHETGHFLGLPDYYDTDSTPGQGIGSFGLMANSWGFDGTQYYPPHLSPFSKINLGWMSPTVISAPGNYSLPAVQNTPTVYRIDDGYPSGEYLLIENRQAIGFDGAMPQDGLVIWHIDMAADINTQSYPGQVDWPSLHYRNAVVQADGDYDLEKGNNRGDSGDVFHGGGVDQLLASGVISTESYQSGSFVSTGHEITNVSASGMTMTFDFNIDDVPTTPPAAPVGLGATATGIDFINLSWTDAANDETSYELSRCSTNTSDCGTPISLPVNSDSYNDSGLDDDTIYYYSVRAVNGAGPSAWNGPVMVATEALALPETPTGLNSTNSFYDLTLSWTPGSGADSHEVWRDGSLLAALGATASSYVDGTTVVGQTYDYDVYAVNLAGPSIPASLTVMVSEPVGALERVAVAETAVSGTASAGAVSDTHDSDSAARVIDEELSGGNKRRRYSFMEHIWRFDNIVAAPLVRFEADLSISSADGEDYQFAYATSQSGPYTPLLQTGSGGVVGADLPSGPSGTSGTLYIQLTDLGRNRNFQSLDQVIVDRLTIFSETVEVFAPTGVAASGASTSSINVTWNDGSGEVGYVVKSPTNAFTQTELPADSTSHTIEGLAISTSYDIDVCAADGSYSTLLCTRTSAATLDNDVAPLNLSAVGYKEKGLQKADLSWSGAVSGSIDILRDGLVIRSMSTGSTGSYTDPINVKGGGAYDYQVCQGSNCSAVQRVVF